MANFEELMMNESFMKELSKKTSKQEVIELFEKNGISFNDDDYIGLCELLNGALHGEAELNENDLDSIAGGAWYKYKCSCGKQFATWYFSHLHAIYLNAKNIVCGDDGFTFCTSDGHSHSIREID